MPIRTISQSINLLRNGISVAEYGENIRIGKEDSTKVIIADGSISPYTTAGTYIIEKVNDTDQVVAMFTATGVSYGDSTTASGTNSFALGQHTTASGQSSQAAGYYSTATAMLSHAEGYTTHATSEGATAIGKETTASGDYSFSEGYSTTASGVYSHAQGTGTTADQQNQFAIGKYNTTSNTNNLFVVGNGSKSGGNITREDAFQVDIYGNVEASGNVNIASGAKYKINGTALAAADVGALPISGGTMTGQLKTSFKTSVAMGSYGSAQSTVEGLVGEVRFSSGCAGSASINTAYTNSGVTIPTGWYNFMYMPHRSGGNSGAADGDNANYGNLFLFGMNNTNGRFIVRVSSGAVADVCKIWTSLETVDYPSAYVHMYVSSKTLNNTATKLTGLSIIGGGNYEDYFDIGTADQVKIKKAGQYHVEIFMRFSSVTNAANVKRISIYKNGAEGSAVIGRPNSYEDVTYWDNLTYAAGDILTMYGRSEDGNATVSYPRVMLTPLF